MSDSNDEKNSIKSGESLDKKTDKLDEDDDNNHNHDPYESTIIQNQTQLINSFTEEIPEPEFNNNKNEINEKKEIDEINNSINFTNTEKKEENIGSTLIRNNTILLKGNTINIITLQKKKNILFLTIDKEKSNLKNHTIYEISMRNYNNKLDEQNKIILCYRRYENFDVLYNVLKIRFPQYVFPRLSPKNYIYSKSNVQNIVISKMVDNNEFLENRRIELQYFINEVYIHKELGQSKEIQKFLNDTIFDNEYYSSLKNKFSYPECSSKINNKGFINQGAKKIGEFISSFYSNANNKNIKNETANSKKISDREEEFKTKIKKYTELQIEIKNIYSVENEQLKNNGLIYNKLSFLKCDIKKNDDESNHKKKFNELSNIIKNINNESENNISNFEEEIIHPLNFAILDFEGISRAIERYKNFLNIYFDIKNYQKQPKDSNTIIEEQTKIDKDINEYETTLMKEIERVDNYNSKLYPLVINKLCIYFKKLSEINCDIFKNSNFYK